MRADPIFDGQWHLFTNVVGTGLGYQQVGRRPPNTSRWTLVERTIAVARRDDTDSSRMQRIQNRLTGLQERLNFDHWMDYPQFRTNKVPGLLNVFSKRIAKLKSLTKTPFVGPGACGPNGFHFRSYVGRTPDSLGPALTSANWLVSMVLQPIGCQSAITLPVVHIFRRALYVPSLGVLYNCSMESVCRDGRLISGQPFNRLHCRGIDLLDGVLAPLFSGSFIQYSVAVFGWSVVDGGVSGLAIVGDVNSCRVLQSFHPNCKEGEPCFSHARHLSVPPSPFLCGVLLLVDQHSTPPR